MVENPERDCWPAKRLIDFSRLSCCPVHSKTTVSCSQILSEAVRASRGANGPGEDGSPAESAGAFAAGNGGEVGWNPASPAFAGPAARFEVAVTRTAA